MVRTQPQCPACNVMIVGSAANQPGSVTVCFNCGSVLVFQMDGALRLPMGDELQDGDSEELRKQIAIAQRIQAANRRAATK